MIYSKSGDIPTHQYCYVERKYITNGEMDGTEPCVWFGIVAYTGRVWGCQIMLKSGAVYREVPIHALSFKETIDPVKDSWSPSLAQEWDCYGIEFSTICYKYLYGLDVKARCGYRVELMSGERLVAELHGKYLFTAVPIGDAYSEAPDEAKEFQFIQLDNGRITCQPTNRVLFIDKSFTDRDAKWPTHLRALEQTYHSE